MRPTKIKIKLILLAFITTTYGFIPHQPKILIIGDSISIGYTAFVKENLKDIAEVHHNPGNAQHTGKGLKNIESWITNNDYDIIQFNWGLWDLCYRHPDSKVQGQRDKINGKITYSLKEYEQQMRAIVKILKEKTDAKLIFVTTSYVPKNEAGRYVQDPLKYNKIAKKIMMENDILINDIFYATRDIHRKYGRGDDDVHYEVKGYQMIGNLIADFIRKTMKGSVTFASDQAFLNQHTDAITLTSENAAIIVVPSYQGRVMTSTYNKETGPSFGWINRSVIEKGILPEEERKGTLQEHIHIFGGEERFWLGPEGGQFGFYFKKGDPFEFNYWKTPSAIDTEPFQMVNSTLTSATFKHKATLKNYNGTQFKMGIERKISLLNKESIEQIIDGKLNSEIHMVAYETDNRLTNNGKKAWTPENGLPSIWLLGMYNPSENTTIIIPFKAGKVGDLGPKVNDTYFGKVPPKFLLIKENALFFKGDGTYRSKIGVNSKRSIGIAGSYDATGNVLTIITYNIQPAPNGYVNSMWEIQEEPYQGDVINAYNDGSPAPGEPPLGPFYEIESSSPAAALAPGETMQHIQKTIHLHGNENELNKIALRMFGVSLEKIKSWK